MSKQTFRITTLVGKKLCKEMAKNGFCYRLNLLRLENAFRNKGKIILL